MRLFYNYDSPYIPDHQKEQPHNSGSKFVMQNNYVMLKIGLKLFKYTVFAEIEPAATLDSLTL